MGYLMLTNGDSRSPESIDHFASKPQEHLINGSLSAFLYEVSMAE